MEAKTLLRTAAEEMLRAVACDTDEPNPLQSMAYVAGVCASGEKGFYTMLGGFLLQRLQGGGWHFHSDQRLPGIKGRPDLVLKKGEKLNLAVECKWIVSWVNPSKDMIRLKEQAEELPESVRVACVFFVETDKQERYSNACQGCLIKDRMDRVGAPVRLWSPPGDQDKYRLSIFLSPDAGVRT